MKKTLLAVSALTLFAGCSHVNSDSGHHGAHWGYEGNEGPSHWGMLKEDYSLCGEGKMQSPIDIRDHQPAGDSRSIEFHYSAASNPTVVNNGHTIQVNYPQGSYAVIGGKRYDLLQFHFHSPSEHMINGKPADMVAHLVHKASDGELAVVAVLFGKGGENGALKAVWEEMPHHQGEETVHGQVNAEDLLPGNKSYFHYTGSLTTPPCSEGVNWNVLKTAVSVSDEQVAAFTSIFPKSVRPVQPLHGRTVARFD